MKKIIIKKVIIGCLIVGLVFGGYKLIKFNHYRYTVVTNSGSLPFKNNLNMLHIYPNLQYVSIGVHDVDIKIEGLESLSDLKHLAFYPGFPAGVTKIEGLDNLHNLEYLNFRLNQIEKIEGLSGLNHIQQINLSYNQISKIENIEEIPLIKNDYCYTFKTTEEGIYSYPTSSRQSDGSFISEDCFLEEEPDEYIDKHLYNDEFEYGEMISPLAKSRSGIEAQPGGYIDLQHNPITSITQESYDYITKYNIDVSLDVPLSSLEII